MRRMLIEIDKMAAVNPDLVGLRFDLLRNLLKAFVSHLLCAIERNDE